MGDSLPVFEDEHRGLMPVGHFLLATNDAGRTWQQARTLGSIPEYSAIEIVKSVVIAIKRDLEQKRPSGGIPSSIMAAKTRLSLYELAPSGDASSNAAEVPVSAGGGIIELSFLSEAQGWTTFSGRLFATKDGGKSWVEITPGGDPTSLGRSKSVPRPIPSYPACFTGKIRLAACGDWYQHELGLRYAIFPVRTQNDERESLYYVGEPQLYAVLDSLKSVLRGWCLLARGR
jgi:hypothetical protein